MNRRAGAWITKAALLPVLAGAVGPAAGHDWPSWRGPEQNGLVREEAVVTSWSQDGENVLWHQPFGGRTTPLVFNGKVYFNGPVGEGNGLQERVVCLDADSGKVLWEHRFNVFHTDIVENRIGWSALALDTATGYVFCHGTGGELFCFRGDGRLAWKVSMTEELGRISGYGGRLHTPIVDGDQVIISFLSSSWGSQAKPAHRYLALNKYNGEVVWWSAPGGKPLDTTYSCPVSTVIDGKRLLIAGNADGNVHAMMAQTGKPIWSYRLSRRGLNSSVVVEGEYAYICHSEENYTNTEMGSIVCINAAGSGDITDSGTVWRRDGYTVGYASPALANGRLYAVNNNATLHCLNARTGDLIWEYDLGRVGKGSPVVTVDGVIYVGEQNGIFHILRDEGDKCVSLDKETFTRRDGSVDEMYGSPAVSNGRVYFMTRYNTYCLGVKGAKVQSLPFGPTQAESGLDYGTADSILLIPAEVTLAPGESAELNPHTFDVNGQDLELWKNLVGQMPRWQLKGPKGDVQMAGKFTAAPDAAWTAGDVEIRWGPFTASARVRILPPMPIREDFEAFKPGGPPPGWVGAAKRLTVIKKDGNTLLKKLAAKERPSPPFMRLRSYFTEVMPVGYTVQCDMLSELKEVKRRSFQPEMGLINCRYRFLAMGGDPKRGRAGKLRIESWSPIPRLRHDVPFTWDSNKWYRVKFDVRESDGQAVCRAKIWPRDETEPDAWSIEVTDAHPNLEGSAGLYAYSTGTTAKSDGPATYFDNLQVYRDD